MALVMPTGGDEKLTVTFPVDDQDEELTIILGPAEYGGVVGSLQWIRDHNLWNGEEKPNDMAAIGLANIQLIQRIKDWEGPVTPDGKKFACTRENKELFFGTFPQALNAIWEALAKKEDVRLGNSGPSPAGSKGSTRKPAKPAARGTGISRG